MAPPEDYEPQELLLDAAIAGIVAHGYDRVRLRDIAVEAGVTTGMIQHYFVSKEELLAAAFERVGLLQTEHWKRVTREQADPQSRLAALLNEFGGGSYGPDQSAAWLELCACSARHTHLRELLAHVNGRWRRLILETIRDGVEKGQMRPITRPEEVADTLVALFDGLEVALASRAATMTANKARRILNQTADLLLAG